MEKSKSMHSIKKYKQSIQSVIHSSNTIKSRVFRSLLSSKISAGGSRESRGPPADTVRQAKTWKPLKHLWRNIKSIQKYKQVYKRIKRVIHSSTNIKSKASRSLISSKMSPGGSRYLGSLQLAFWSLSGFWKPSILYFLKSVSHFLYFVYMFFYFLYLPISF